MANQPGLYNALAGASSNAAPAPAAPAASGAGSLYDSLIPQPQAPGSQPLQLGPMVADNSDMQNSMRDAFNPSKPFRQASPPAVNQPSSGPNQSITDSIKGLFK